MPSEEPHTVAEDRVTEEDHSGNECQVGESDIQGEESTEISKIVDEQTVHEEGEDEKKKRDTEDEAVAEAAETSEAPEKEEGEKPHKLTIDDIKTAPMDFRFPTTNQARHCFTRYVEYHKCIRVKGEGNPECDKYARYYRSLCPTEWIERWNEQRENGTFPGPL